MPVTDYIGPNDEEVLMAWDSMCDDHQIGGNWADLGPKALSIWADYLRLGATAELWARVQTLETEVEEAAENLGVQRQPAPLDPIVGELELRATLVSAVLLEVGMALSDRRAAFDMGEPLPPIEDLHQRCLSAVNETYQDAHVRALWETNTFVSEYDE